MECAKKVLMCLVITLVMIVTIIMTHKMGIATEVTAYPERDITLIVVFRPGGGTDTIARLAAPFIQQYLPKRVNVTVQNLAEAGGRVGCFRIYDSKPDGYTFGLMEPTVFTVAALMGQMGHRDMNKITWLPRATAQPFMLVASPQSPIKNLKDLSGKKVRAACSQATLPCSITTLEFLGAETQPIMYDGGADCLLATMRGDTDLTIQVYSTVLRQVAASKGQLIPLCVFAENRLREAPDVPTSKELGVAIPEDLMVLLTNQNVFAAPPELPEDVHKILSNAIEKTLRDPAFIEKVQLAKIDLNVLSSEEVQEKISKLSSVLAKYEETLKKAFEK